MRYFIMSFFSLLFWFSSAEPTDGDSRARKNNIIKQREPHCESFDTSIKHDPYLDKNKFIVIREQFNDSLEIYINSKLLIVEYAKSGIYFDRPTAIHRFKLKGKKNIITINLLGKNKFCQFFCYPDYKYIKIDRAVSAEENFGAWQITFSNKEDFYH